MREKILGIDIDSTIYPFHDAFLENLKEITGKEHQYSEWSSWSYWNTVYGAEILGECFERTLDPKKVPQRKFYSGCVNAINTLRYNFGITPAFITHNHKPEEIKPYLVDWLHGAFGEGFYLFAQTSKEPKIEVIRNLGALGIIDDAPHTLEDVADEGLIAIALKHPWNLSLLEQREDIVGITNWQEVVGHFAKLKDSGRLDLYG